ncbi:dihydrolipoyl dehydrogenase [Candidatus Pandoraea novymonadis]|uniref:Dihydrolipoyl dehydrogenase n=1 Tax=Candidatus Pandoraea novymonadis TaxID=1808959 RepID=A0ABX5FFD9_9BURK|nr:dihydrolipoyl dehydrogenase [Candidatus Pandoraea novymonadis]PSB91947.1 Dihydrolipoyl dehydrogenase [Candidatus Pandoraea novymonadis]
MNFIEIKVPDIGVEVVEVVEIMIKPGDTIVKNQSLVILESDKTSIEVPSEVSGVVKAVEVKERDKVSKGTLIAVVESTAYASDVVAKPTVADTSVISTLSQNLMVSNPSVAKYVGDVDIECDVIVIGAGPGGYSAAFRSADLGRKTVLVERHASLGGVCLNVGCIPSKTLLHIGSIMEEAIGLSHHGVSFGKPIIDLDKLREYKKSVVARLTNGLDNMAKIRKVEVVCGIGNFVDTNHLEVTILSGGKRIIKFGQAIIAAGSEALKLPFFPEDPRIVDSTGALALREIPKKMLVVGGGIIGLEMATFYSALGSNIDIVEMNDGLMQGADPDLVNVWEKKNTKRFGRVMLKTKTVGVEPKGDGIYVTFKGESAPEEAERYDLILVAIGRTPNGKKISAHKAGITVTDLGFIPVDNQMRTNVPNIFAIGDIVGQPMLAHKAVHEAHVAAEVAHGEKAYFDVLQIPSVAYTDPEVAWTGKTEESLKAEDMRYEKAFFPWVASGRAIANGCDEGFTKLLFDQTTHRIIGGGIVGKHAGDLIGEICLAIEMGADAVDIAKTIHPHPTLGESIGMAAEIYEGICTDVPPSRKN